MGFCQRPQRLRDLRVLLFPEPIPAEGRLRAHAADPGTLLMQPQLNGLTAPSEHPLRLAGIASTIFQRHRRLEGAALHP
jgi:hypothetical protein